MNEITTHERIAELLDWKECVANAGYECPGPGADAVVAEIYHQGWKLYRTYWPATEFYPESWMCSIGAHSELTNAESRLSEQDATNQAFIAALKARK